MLPCFQTCFDQAGRSKAAIARDCEITVQHLYKLFSGKFPVAKHRRARLDRAFGFPVDWAAYEAEASAARAEAIGAPPEAPKVRAAPHRPEPTPKAPARSPIAGKWGEPITPAPKARPAAPPKAAPAPAAPAPRKGFFANLIRDDGEEPFI